MEQRTEKPVGEGLFEENLIKAINCKVIPVGAYMMNVCNFKRKELDQDDTGIKKILRENNMHGKQCSDDQLHLRRKLGGKTTKRKTKPKRRMERSMEKNKNLMKEKSKDKKMQSEAYEKLDEESQGWLQCNIEPKKVTHKKLIK